MTAGIIADPGGALPFGSFTLEVVVAAPIDAVWQTIARGELRGRWLRLPGRPGPQTPVDLLPGATETLSAQATIGDVIETLERTTQVVDVAPGRRAVLVYRAVVNDQPRWASLVTLSLDTLSLDSPPGPDDHPDSTRLTWTEQYTFLVPSGADEVAHLRGGTRLMLTALAVSLGVTPRPASER